AILPQTDIYVLRKFERSNQDTTINQRPLVKVGDRVKAGDIIADGQATSNGELALGRNVLVAFLPWYGYNFEDAIVISERLVRDDVFTSVHIKEFELEVRDTKLGPEELTRDIPHLGEELLKNLNENGIVYTGAEVESGDILVGKVTPRGESELTPEERLLRAIFGEKAEEVKDASLRVPPGIQGIVIGSVVLSRREQTEEAQKKESERLKALQKELKNFKKEVIRSRNEKLIDLLSGCRVRKMVYADDDKEVIEGGEVLTKDILEKLDFDAISPDTVWVDESEVDRKVKLILERAKLLIEEKEEEINEKTKHAGDILPVGVRQLVKVYVAMKRKITVGDKLSGRHGNKGVIAKIVPIEDMPFLPDGTPVDIVLNPLGVPSRMNIGQILETHIGWAAKKLGLRIISPVFNGATVEDVKRMLIEAGLPHDGKTILYNGKTGEPFENPAVVGYMYIMKLVHMADDKIHARSTGPYSLITQQPLGGKSRFGGQRFGEMEVWALEAYGAAHTLQEMLTVKSDDIEGRTKIFESIIKGENP
ncbi:MAG: DNA-directed RNA polymerase subunit beta, partial [bacterium]